MAPKARITRELILDAAYEITRESGIESVNVRSIAKRLQCSTQPVLYYFATVEEIRQAVFDRADAYQTEYIMGAEGDNPMLAIGTAYVRFAATEKHLFRLLFQTDHYAQLSLEDLMNAEPTQPILGALAQEAHLTHEQAKDTFMACFLLVHGMASMLANNAMIYDEAFALRVLGDAFDGAMYVFEKGKTEKRKPEMDSLPQP